MVKIENYCNINTNYSIYQQRKKIKVSIILVKIIIVLRIIIVKHIGIWGHSWNLSHGDKAIYR